MRRILLSVTLGASCVIAGDPPPALTFEDITRLVFADFEALERRAALARSEEEIASSGTIVREGPTLAGEIGPRHTRDAGTRPDLAVRLEVPLTAAGPERRVAQDRLARAAPLSLAAESARARLRLRLAFLDAWFEQERLAAVEDQLEAIALESGAVRRRVEAGSEAPYELALVEAEATRLRADADTAREARGAAWAELRALADVAPAPVPLAGPGAADLASPADAASRYRSGVWRSSVARGRDLEAALADLDRAHRASRWSVSAGVLKEGIDSAATVGAGYRFPLRGETAARRREAEATRAFLARRSDAAVARLDARFESLIDRIRSFGAPGDPAAFDEALRAVALRLEAGKDRPSVALPIRRQLLEARSAALGRIREAHALRAELDALLAGETP